MIFFLMGLLRWRCFSFGLVLVLVLLGIFDGLGFKSAAWVSNQRREFADRWFGWWVWRPLLAPTGLMVCVWLCRRFDGLCLRLCLCVCVCVWGDRLIGEGGS